MSGVYPHVKLHPNVASNVYHPSIHPCQVSARCIHSQFIIHKLIHSSIHPFNILSHPFSIHIHLYTHPSTELSFDTDRHPSTFNATLNRSLIYLSASFFHYSHHHIAVRTIVLNN
ncbi:unnamed protein product [Mucor circinelloides]